MSEKGIDIKIEPDGTVSIDMVGYNGTGCDVDMKKLLKALNADVVSSKKKQEFYDDAKVQVRGEE